jgi:pimeloyl-ACP methyl ester carboxylesterase
MVRVRANGIDIEYETLGEPSHPTVLLIMGLGAQLIHWPDVFCQGLAAHGFHVVRFDNRDSGLSTSRESWGRPDLATVVTQVMSGERADVPYRLDDMAADAVGLLDALGIGRAHIVGASMGGSIAQLVAGHYPERTRSLVSMMSTSGRPELTSADRDVVRVILGRPPPDDREALIRYIVRVRRTIGSPRYPESEAKHRALVERVLARAYNPDGNDRQYAAVIASGHRVELLQRLRVPTLVLHGEDDLLLPQEHARDTAMLVPGSEIQVYPGWGHDIPKGLVPTLVERIARFCHAAG